MRVLVNGIGNIGTTVLQVLVHYKTAFGISEIYANKNSLKPWQQPEMDYLQGKGVILTSPQKLAGFESFDIVLKQVDYVFECGANGSGIRNKPLYESLKNIKGVSAQGSEKGFGISYMSCIANELIAGAKFVHVVSCNTHGTAAILTSISGKRLENLASADFVVVRRSEDLGSHERLVSANVVARHLSPENGTHHAVDVVDMFNALGVSCKLSSSDITTPSQLMHAVRFQVQLKKALSKKEMDICWKNNPYIATTQKFDSNIIFEQGRRYGFNGRIYSHAIVVSENLLIAENTIKGWAFVPQEGNSILSTIHAFLLQMQVKEAAKIMSGIQADLLRKVW
jgi:glyceraldehyde-3-phosphate dehydrogenase type II